MFNEKVIQIDGSKVLTNKGRVFEYLVNMNGAGYWNEITLPQLANNVSISPLTIGKKVSFVEPITPREKFDNAKDIGSLINN